MRIMDIEEFDPSFDPAQPLDPQLAPYSAYVEEALASALAPGDPVQVVFPDGYTSTLQLGPDGQLIDPAQEL